MKKIVSVFLCAAFIYLTQPIIAQELLTDSLLTSVHFRSIGPAHSSGRIADIQIHPLDPNTWYVAVGSGGVWKTTNAGTTWQPIFEKQSVYSTGCLAIDPSNPHTVWLGTGENVGGRHVGFGDGVYVSYDDGGSWKNMGLKKSEHISKIIVDPNNSNRIWVAAQGPLWNKGGERGVYLSEDGGNTWKQTLGDKEWVGATDLVIDPDNSEVLYAATWQRHRNVAAYMGGGEGSGIYKSQDGGSTWTQLKAGLPSSNLGKIGLAISPQNHEVLYAAIELDRRKGAVYRSENSGQTFSKMSDAVSGGTGPHYYQELYASPHEFDKIFLCDWMMQISDDGGKTFRKMNEKHKHVDNHALAFKKGDPDYLLVGTDGGLFETFDGQKTWRHISNLPVTQFYKIAVDNTVPNYRIYGGTQDNYTQGAPSRTFSKDGITNADWDVILFGDGHQPAVDPEDPNIVYAEWQEGNLTRTNQKTGEIMYIQPQPDKSAEAERFNWDSPILISPHNHKTIYYASQHVWKSTDRGDSWKKISPDLTKNQNRLQLPIMGGKKGYDNPWDLYAMSEYNTITSLAESPKQPGLLYAGTDDGLLHVSEDGGKSWRKISFEKQLEIPATCFVNDIKADLHDASTVYVCLDNHKFGDFTPYFYVSKDKGKTWSKRTKGLGENSLVWRVVQDHKNANLLFLGTEFGLYFSVNEGKNWIPFKGDLPTIAIRDLAIQPEMNDLVLATFGRGIYILDDYSFLQKASDSILSTESHLFAPRDGWWYIRKMGKSGHAGDDFYSAKNPPYGVSFDYYFNKEVQNLKEARKKEEKKRKKENKPVEFKTWDELDEEMWEQDPNLYLEIVDQDKNRLRLVAAKKGKKGFYRAHWDLKSNPTSAIRLKKPHSSGGYLSPPGKYYAALVWKEDGVEKRISNRVEFQVKPLPNNQEYAKYAEQFGPFMDSLRQAHKLASAISLELSRLKKKNAAMKLALENGQKGDKNLSQQLYNQRRRILELVREVDGHPSKEDLGEKTKPTIQNRLNVAIWGMNYSTYGPTPTHSKSLLIAMQELKEVSQEIDNMRLVENLEIQKRLKELDAPWVEGMQVPLGH